MMKLAILLISAGFLIAAYRKSKNISDPYVAFNSLWFAVAILINVGSRLQRNFKGIINSCYGRIALIEKRGAVA